MKKQPQVTEQTRSNLRQAFWELYAEKPVEKISVREITDRAGYNRATFYLYYHDVYELLDEIESMVLGNIERLVNERLLKGEKLEFSQHMSLILRLAQRSRDYTRVLLGPHGDISFLHRIEGIISDHCLNVLKVTFPDQLEDLKYSYSFCLSGCIGLTKTWLNGQYEETPQHMAEITFRLIMNALHGSEHVR